MRAFLVADIRGYSAYTTRHGDAAAADLAARFAAVSAAAVEARGGRVVEVRGDEVLAEFGSPRDAVLAAAALQEAYAARTPPRTR